MFIGSAGLTLSSAWHLGRIAGLVLKPASPVKPRRKAHFSWPGRFRFAGAVGFVDVSPVGHIIPIELHAPIPGYGIAGERVFPGFWWSNPKGLGDAAKRLASEKMRGACDAYYLF